MKFVMVLNPDAVVPGLRKVGVVELAEGSIVLSTVDNLELASNVTAINRADSIDIYVALSDDIRGVDERLRFWEDTVTVLNPRVEPVTYRFRPGTNSLAEEDLLGLIGNSEEGSPLDRCARDACLDFFKRNSNPREPALQR